MAPVSRKGSRRKQPSGGVGRLTMDELADVSTVHGLRYVLKSKNRLLDRYSDVDVY